MTIRRTGTAATAARRRPRRALALAVVGVLALGAPSGAQDRSSSEIGEDLEDNRQRGDEAAERLAATEAAIVEARDELVMLRARLTDAQGRLRQLEGQLALADEELGDAESRRIAAEENLAEALRMLEETEAELEVQEQRFRGQVANTYKYGAAGRSAIFLQMVRTAQSPSDLAARMHELKSIVNYQSGVVDQVEALRAEREELRARAEATRRQAREARDDAAAAVELMTSLRDDAADVAAAIATDEARQAEILASLNDDKATLERVLGEVAAEEERLEAELAAERARRASSGAGVCAVDGAKAGRDFINDWGFPRPGGRSHEGTDIFANRGTPVRAMYEGTVKEIRRADAGLGGLFVSYWSGPGEHWYNAHLDAVPAGLQVGDPVQPGTLIGTVGNSGNARGTPPHLHIGHYVDDEPVNPYPVLEQACRG